MSETHADITTPLARDLSLVLAPPVAVDAACTVGGKTATVSDALDAAAAMLAEAKSPAVLGLVDQSIEGVRAAVDLARTLRARLLPWPTFSVSGSTQRVTQTGTLGNACASDLILWVGCRGTDSAITKFIAENQLLAAFLAADLPTVLKLRRLLNNTAEQSPFGNAKRITAVLAHGADPRVVAQWHLLANQVQRRHRLSVIQLPAAGNARGAFEAVTWLSGLSPTRGGIDFRGPMPVACGDAKSLIEAGAIDVLLDLRRSTDGLAISESVQRIAIGPTNGNSASVALGVPPLKPGIAARVMRFDGVCLWLCNDPARGEPDLAAELLTELARRLRSR